YIACSENLFASITRDKTRAGIARIAARSNSTPAGWGLGIAGSRLHKGGVFNQVVSWASAFSLNVAISASSATRKMGMMSLGAHRMAVSTIDSAAARLDCSCSDVPAVLELWPSQLAAAPATAVNNACQ